MLYLQFLRQLCLCGAMGRRNKCLVTLVTLLAVWSLSTLLQNVKNVIHIRPTISSSSSVLDRYTNTIKDRSNFDKSPQIQKNKAAACKKYHVVLIIATADDAREASFLLKTLLYHRRSQVHLHLVVNDLTHVIARTLMETWEIHVDQFYFDLYKVNTTSDPAFYWEALKFRLSDLIPPDVIKEVVYLGNDVRLMDDISVLWKQVEEIDRGNKSFGLIIDSDCNDSQLCYTDKIVWFHLDKFHRSSLDLSLRTAKTKSELDEIIFLELHNHSVFSIPCNWALSLTVTSYRVDCDKDWRSVKALVQSGFETSFISDPMMERVREYLATVLRSEPPTMFLPVDCLIPLSTSSPKDDLRGNLTVESICAEFENSAHLKRRTHLYYMGDGGMIGDHVSPDPYEVSLLTQLTLDRFGVLERFLRLWEGPATVVFHLTDAEAMELHRKIQESNVLRNRKSVTYHVVYKRQIYNPINYLRNVALNSSRSPYLLFVDVDLIPSTGLYRSLKQLIKEHMNEHNKDTVLVVPAFQMFTDLGDATPRNKSQLLKFMPNKTIVGYGMERRWKDGHKPTNYSHWITAQKPYQAIFADHYEPYVVVRRNFEARYNELLIERMADKTAYSELLREQGFKFFVIPDDFIVHVPHPLSPGMVLSNEDPKFVRCAIQFLNAYYKEIEDRLNRTRTVL